jgi:hypothetical protein
MRSCFQNADPKPHSHYDRRSIRRLRVIRDSEAHPDLNDKLVLVRVDLVDSWSQACGRDRWSRRRIGGIDGGLIQENGSLERECPKRS